MIEQRRDRPHLHRMAGGKRCASRPEIAGMFFVGASAAKNFLQNPGNNQAVEQRFCAENANLPPFRIVAPAAVIIGTSPNGNQSISRANVRNASPPAYLPATVFECIREVRVRGNQRSDCRRRYYPLERVFAIGM